MSADNEEPEQTVARLAEEYAKALSLKNSREFERDEVRLVQSKAQAAYEKANEALRAAENALQAFIDKHKATR